MIDRWIVDNDPSRAYPLYTRGNVGEVFPLPVTPLTWTLGAVPACEAGWRDAFERFGAFDRSEFADDAIEILGCFGGYAYLNVSVSRILGVRTPGLTPEQVDYSFWGEMPGIRPYRARPGDEAPERTEAVERTLAWILSAPDLDELRDDQAAVAQLRARRPDFDAMAPGEITAWLRAIVPELRRLFAAHIFVSYCSTVPLGMIQAACDSFGEPTLAMRLVAGIGDVDSAAPSAALWELGRLVAGSASLTAAFDEGVAGLADRIRARALRSDPDAAELCARFEEFLYAFGSRGPNEWETSSPSWETSPDLALAAVDRMRLAGDDAAPRSHMAALVADREALGAQVLDRLAADPGAQARTAAALRAAPVFLAGRERTKTTVIRLVNEMRVASYAFGRRYLAAGVFERIDDYAMLLDSELEAFVGDPEAFAGEIRSRRREYESLFDLEPPFVIDGEVPPLRTWARVGRRPETVAAGTTLAGIPGCPGSAKGRARVILDPTDPSALEPGDVLVAPITDPAWTPLFVPAAAVVVDVGAQISHAVIVSRELGIPCVVSVTDATRRIPDGAMVTVDGTAGTVTVEA
ncbi:MAG: phosphoenolpyruvate-utilizing protein [Actinobacteria bacterium]|nr:phosphoenolpyruvate-utilizing protein [Actinomycetota bacterium]